MTSKIHLKTGKVRYQARPHQIETGKRVFLGTFHTREEARSAERGYYQRRKRTEAHSK